MKLSKKFGRYAACILLVAAIFLVYEGRLFQWQILEGEAYAQASLENQTDTIELDAARGELRDRNGQVLAGNRTTYDIVYNALNMVYEERNATIIKVIDLLEEQDEDWRDVLPIVIDENGVYQFAEDRESDVAALKEALDLAEYASADECIRELADTYRCGGLSTEDTRNVASVRYSMTRDGFSRTNPYVIARDVSAETVGIISQRSQELKGVEPQVAVARYYGEDGSLAPHVVGYTNAIQDWQLEQAEENGTRYHYKDNISGYKSTDSVGIDGLEAAFETELRGQRGLETIFTDDAGDLKSTAVTVEPKEGNTVYTTLDSDLQRAANISLKKNIQENTSAKDCTSGAAVVLDVKDFGILASSSYPTYDLNLYNTDDDYVSRILGDEVSKPMYDRALQGTYTPGSAFKPMVALAALQEGVINASTTIQCDGEYVCGDGPSALTLGCLSDRMPQNVYTALSQSCNVFFCNVGVNLTIKKMDAYAEYFGLGAKTGVELDESLGNMSNPQDYLERHGEQWLDGASAQTAIGQADNLFTPLQLAVYCATMANGGRRLQAHFLQKVTDYTGKEVLEEYQPKVLYDAELSDDVLNVVREGMRMVGSTGTASDVFGEYPVSVACKTGTAETATDKSREPNLSFICYAPADAPEIAVAVLLEKGNKGVYAQKVARDILDQYFGFHTWDEEGNRYNQNGDMVDDEDKVLKTKEELDREKAEEEKRKQQEFLSSSSSSSAPQSAAESTPSPLPEVSSQGSGRDDIPTTPYTGESSQPESSAPEAVHSPTPAPSGGKKQDSPYYGGKGASPSPNSG